MRRLIVVTCVMFAFVWVHAFSAYRPGLLPLRCVFCVRSDAQVKGQRDLGPLLSSARSHARWVDALTEWVAFTEAKELTPPENPNSADSCWCFTNRYCETWFYTGQTNAETRSWGKIAPLTNSHRRTSPMNVLWH